MRRFLIAVSLAVLLAAGLVAGAPSAGAGIREITFKTVDGWTIHADYSTPAGAKTAVILLHQRGGSAADWKPLVARLNAARIATLAIDQRGHGRSLGAQTGANAPWQTSNDIAGGIKWLGQRGFAAERIGLAGASYGANNALIYAAAHRRVPSVALLSPGLNYHGLLIGPPAARYGGAVLVLSAKDDPITGGGPELVASVGKPGTVQRISYGGGDHGTSLLAADPSSLKTLTDFFKRRL